MMNRFKSVDWLAGVFYPLAIILMEAFWVYPCLAWMGNWPIFTELRPVLSLASVIIVLAISLLVTRISIRQEWPMWLIRSITIGCSLVTIFLVMRIEYNAGYAFLDGQWFIHAGQMLGAAFTRPYPIVLALPVLLYLWWRGITLGSATPHFGNIYRSFLLGIVALIVLVVLWQLSSGSGNLGSSVSDIGAYVIAFFFCGLMALAICYLHLMRRQMTRENAALTPAWRWLPMMLGVIGGIVVVGLGIASLFSAELITSIEQGARVAFGALAKALNYILIPFNYLLEGIYKLLRLIVGWLRPEQLPQSDESGLTPRPEWPEVVLKEIPPEVAMVIKWIVVAAIVAAVIYFLAKAVSRYRAKRAQAEIEETHESLWSWSVVTDDLRLLLSTVRQKFQRKHPLSALPRYHLDEDTGSMDIRQIYRHLLWEATRSGLAHHSYETACEYAERLGEAVPDGREPLVQLTDLYINVRYGDIRAQEEQINSANSLWKALRSLLWRLRGT